MKQLLYLILLLIVPSFLHSDEGMWTFDNLPTQTIQKKYGFKITKDWQQKVQFASVRFNDGGSGAFVSSQGLVITNHHVALGQLQKMSNAKNNYAKAGFLAQSKENEIPCPDLELNVLISYENVTSTVTASLKSDSLPETNLKEIRRRLAELALESDKKTGLKTEAVELYNGGEYWLYRYKRYTDIRLVMAPEFDIAFFGGDLDNFVFPRYVLDYAFFRVYEDKKPISSPNYFAMSKVDLKENDLVFVAGHPGKTSRLKTVKELEYEKDYSIPSIIRLIQMKILALENFSKKDPEKSRKIQSQIYYLRNSLKSLEGKYNGLIFDAVINKRAIQEREFQKAIEANPDYKDKFGKSIEAIDGAIKEKMSRHLELLYAKVPDSKLASFAVKLVLYAKEIQKPNTERYKEYRESNLPSLKFQLTSNAPIYKDIEEFNFNHSLNTSLKGLGKAHPFIKAAMKSQKSVERLSKSLVQKTKLHTAEMRIKLINEPESILKSKDPLIQWAIQLEPEVRKLRDWYENKVESILVKEGNNLSKARFLIKGKTTYPDATFTLRLSFGKVAGYSENTSYIPFRTSFYGLLDRANNFNNKPPFQIPEKVSAAIPQLDLQTPLNIVTTNDIIGGNSGSPLFTKDLKYVGIIFDGNSYSHVWDYIYTEERARAISVHSSAILESLNKIYKANELLKELGH